MENLNALKARMADIVNIGYAASVLSWDQQTYMPPGAAHARASQLATLSKLGHEMFIADETARLIEAAATDVAGMEQDSDEASIVRVTQEDYERATKLPADWVAEFAKLTTLAHESWVKARQENDYETFRPTLEQIFDMCRQRADYLGYEEHMYDALLDRFEPGMKSSKVAEVFSNLREDLVPFAAQIFEQQDSVSAEPLHRDFDVEKQHQFGLMVAEQLGYDLNRGRQDEVVHPFCTSFSRNDVRITTRFDKNFLNPALFGTIHETGHALYEQGISPSLEGTALASGVSLGIHESQSRLWENVIGRSYGFWKVFYGKLQETYAGVLDDVALDDFWRAINKVQPSLIRVEADEVTYPLHIMLRFELEMDIISGNLNLKDAPDAWNAKFEQYLGITPPTDTVGILQDVHWSSGIIGYFPTYALGTLLSTQLYEAALRDHPELPNEIESGKFDTILHWMNTHIHQHGRKFKPADLIRRATGQDLDHKAYMRYLQNKYSQIYSL